MRHVAALRHLFMRATARQTHRPAMMAAPKTAKVGRAGQHTSCGSLMGRRLRGLDRSLANSGVPDSSAGTSSDCRLMNGDGGLATASMVDAA